MSIFKFKQFNIQQKLSAAKVGTDGVLLGAWASLTPSPKTILDVGTGTGLIALMMAQRYPNSNITAIEAEEKAFKEAQYNFNQSIWSDRLWVEHNSFQSFKTSGQFNLIVSNPPFYKEDTLSSKIERSMARSEKHLPFKVIIEKSAALLTAEGVLAVIIPHANEAEFLALGKDYGLFPTNICHVQGHANSPIKRSLLALSKSASGCQVNNLIIEKDRHEYTPAYRALTQDFYLKM